MYLDVFFRNPLNHSGATSMLALGQVERSVPDWSKIVEISYDAWTSLPAKVFQASWIACGYTKWEDYPENPQETPITIEDCREVLDVFGGLQGTPQRCTCFEWQIEDRMPNMTPLT